MWLPSTSSQFFPSSGSFNLWRSFQQCEEITHSYGHLTNNIFTERCNIHSPLLSSSSGLDPLHACLQRFNKVGANIPHRAWSILSSCCHAVAVSSTPMKITSHYITPLPAWSADTNQSPLSCSLYQIPTLPSKCRSTNQTWADWAVFLTFYGLILLSLCELQPQFTVLNPQMWHLVWSAAVKSICYKVWHVVLQRCSSLGEE